MPPQAPGPGTSLPLRVLRACVVPAVLLALWQGLSLAKVISPLVLPSPAQVFLKWGEYASPLQAYDPAKMGYLRWLLSGELLHDMVATVMRVAVGFAIGAGLALPLGMAMGAFRNVYNLFNPLLQVLRPIPPIAYIPLAILWFGLGNPPAFFLISLGAFFPVLMNTIAGVRHVDNIYLRAARNLGATPLDMFLRVMLPAATQIGRAHV